MGESMVVERNAAHVALPKVAAVVFDFDGVIVESTDIKTEAFAELFAEYPEHREAILAHHLEHLGVSRYRKIEWIHERLLGQPLSDEQIQARGADYAQLVRQKVLTCPFVPGAQQLLAELQGRLPLYVASGTPQEELDWLIEQRGLGPFFETVWGSPAAKEDALAIAAQQCDVGVGQVLMVGDGLTDYRAAERAGSAFVARLTPAMEQHWRQLDVIKVDDMDGLRLLLA